MKSWFLILSLFISSTAFGQKDESFFYVLFSKCQENFVNFSVGKDIDVNAKENYSLVCTDKNKFVHCKLLDSKGKTIKEDQTKKHLNLPGMSSFRGENGMEITVMKGTGGVLFTQTSPIDLQSVSQLVCRGEVKDSSDLKNLERSKELLGPKKPAKLPPAPKVENITPEMIGD